MKRIVLTEEEAHQINKQGILYVLKASNSDEMVEKSKLTRVQSGL